MEEIEAEVERKGMALSGAKTPYQCAMYGKWKWLEQFYKDKPMEVVGQLTTNNDTALHVVASAGHNNVLHSLISLIDERIFWMSGHALKMENNHGNTPLHEVAVSGNLEAAKHLMDAAIKFKSIDPSYEDVLGIRNRLGETPLYKAAALGSTKLVKYLAGQVQQDVESHFKREKDEISILHIAIIGQHFETAFWLLKKYPDLAKKKENNGLTSLQLLAHMPSAFEAKFHKSIWKMFIYESFQSK
ncbi:espin-like protein [Prunus avium]|uniref:Espin-like protein n=1 Tax=Prunus avium TaxID=42229 RepID=A0A6P5T5K8_PRUAV|nr:espin-like protein [Prunus avium]